MNELFNQETINLVMDLLKTAADGSVTVLIVYFALPALMLVISTGAWLCFGVVTVKAAKYCVDKLLSSERMVVNKFNIGKHFISTCDGGDGFMGVIESIKSTTYVHECDVEWLKQAVKNQKALDNNFGKTKRNPYKWEQGK